MQTMTEAVDPTLMRAKVRVGRMLHGKWRLDALLGMGGMAAVYAATHRNGSRAAIKILHAELAMQPEVRARFFREGRVANAVGHPGAVKVLDEDETEDGSVFLVMELLEGESLDARMARKGGKLEVDEVLAIADQVLDVLNAAHAKNIVHRDLKPENVFLLRNGEVRVLDFGIARLRELSTASNMTRDGSTLGTPAYMAPEQARGVWDEVDGRADIWALGATMFTLISGKAVHEGRTPNEVLVSAVTRKAPRLPTVMRGIPSAVADVVDRALVFEKENRWPNAAAMQEALRHAYHDVQGAPISTHPKLTVPMTVPDRTVASTAVDFDAPPFAATTGPAVVAGRTGVPLTTTHAGASGLPLVAIGAGAAGLVMLLVFVIAAVALLRRSDPGAPEGTVEPIVAAHPDKDPAPLVESPASQATQQAVDPNEDSKVRVFRNPGLDAGAQPAATATATSQKAASPAPRPTASPPPTHWKDNRR